VTPERRAISPIDAALREDVERRPLDHLAARLRRHPLARGRFARARH
jgi:hypothetical protein